MVICQVCKNEYVVITQLHLKKHNLDIKSYLKKYPNAKIRDDYTCIECGILVTNGTSSKNKYCPTCSEIVNDINKLKNVRKYNAKKKKLQQKLFTDANKEYGLLLDENIDKQSRIDSTHAQWTLNPKDIGTISDYDLSVNDDGRVRQAVWLEKEKQKIKDKLK